MGRLGQDFTVHQINSKPGEAEPISDVEAVSCRPVRRIRAAGE
jgi:hypothetical protein